MLHPFPAPRFCLHCVCPQQIPSLPRRLGHLNLVPYVLPLQHKIDSLVGTLNSPNRTRRVALDDVSGNLRRDLDSLNVISWPTANRPRRKARKTCQKDVLHLARSIFLPLRNLLDAAKKGRQGTSVFPGDTFPVGAALGEHFSGVFRGHEKGRPVGRPVRCGLWQRLVGHVHRGAGNGANGLAGRLLNFAVHDRAKLSSLFGARLGGHVLE